MQRSDLLLGEFESVTSVYQWDDGELVRLAGNHPCPLNRAAVRLIERITRERAAPRRSHLDDMAADLASQGSPA